MSTLPKLFFVLLIAAFVAIPSAFAEQSAIGTVIGSKDVTQVVGNQENNYVEHQYIDEDAQIYSPTYINFIESLESAPHVNYLGVGDADETRLLYPGRFLVFATHDNQTLRFRSAVAMAVYLIPKGNDLLLLQDDRSMMDYNPIFQRFEHGMVKPSWIFDQYTTRCTVTAGANQYLVIDNRGPFKDYSMIELVTVKPTPE